MRDSKAGFDGRKMSGVVITLVVALFFAFSNERPAFADHVGGNELVLVNNNLLSLASVYMKAGENEKAGVMMKIKAVIDKRKAKLVEKMENDPEHVQAYLLPSSYLTLLPAEIQELLEAPMEAEGTLAIIAGMTAPEGPAIPTMYFLTLPSGIRYQIHFGNGRPADLTTGSTVKIQGVALDRHLFVAAADGSSVNTIIQAIAASPTGQQHVLAMLVHFTNYSNQPWSPSQISSTLFASSNSVNAYYRDSSFDKTYFDGDVTNWITIPYDNTNCGSMYETWADAADAAATAAGYNLANYRHKLYVMAGGSGCGWAGASYVGGAPNRTWTNNYNNASLFDHELGHAIGMWHASTRACGSKPIDVYGNCSDSEYGDLWDTMGSWNTYQNNGAHKVQQTWIAGANVQTVTSDGVYTLAPMETALSAVQILKIYKADTNENYYFEYRQPKGFDSALPASMTGGVGVHTMATKYNTFFLDSTPGDANFSNAPLADGRSFQDIVNGLTVSQLSHDANQATVQVTFGTPVCGLGVPAVSINPASQSGVGGQTLTYTLSVTNNDSAVCASSTFGIQVTGLPGGFTSSAANVSLAPGASGNGSLSVTSPTGVADGSYTFTATVADINRSTHGNSVPGTYIAFTDLISPTVSITGPSTISKGNVKFTATATDNVGVQKVEFYLDAATTPFMIDNVTPYTVTFSARNVANGAHTLKAVAYDASGNKGSASMTFTKK